LRHDHAVYTENFAAFLKLLESPENEVDYEKLLRLAIQMRADLSSTANFWFIVITILKDRKEGVLEHGYTTH